MYKKYEKNQRIKISSQQQQKVLQDLNNEQLEQMVEQDKNEIVKDNFFLFGLDQNSSGKLKKHISLKDIQSEQKIPKQRKYSETDDNNFDSHLNINNASSFHPESDEISFQENFSDESEEFFNDLISKSETQEDSQIGQLLLQQDIPYENGKFQNSFTDINLIGNGAFGHVYQALYKIEERYYAIKQIPVKIKQGENIRQMPFFREVQTMVNLRKDGLSHKNIVEYITCWIEEGQKNQQSNLEETESEQQTPQQNNYEVSQDSNLEIVFEIEEETKQKKEFNTKQKINYEHLNLYIQMEYCAGRSLNFYLLNSNQKLENKFIYFIFSEILEGLIYLHSTHILHRDMKPANIFIAMDNIKIGDFGLATMTQKKQKYTQLQSENAEDSQKISNKENQDQNQFSQNIGTPLYIAPEQETSQNYNEKADIFSLGIILFECLMDFQTQHARIKQMVMIKKTGEAPEQLKNKYPIESSLVEMLVQRNPDKRPTGKEIKQSDYFKQWTMKIEKQIHHQNNKNHFENINQIQNIKNYQLNYFFIFSNCVLFLLNILNKKIQIQINNRVSIFKF